jgi:chromate transporter
MIRPAERVLKSSQETGGDMGGAALAAAAAAPTFREAVGAWTRVALASFGGPAGQIAVIHRIMVEEKRWVDEPRFLHALSYCMLLPGPEAQQLISYLGWTLHGTRGALVAGTLFVLPGFLAILVLSLLYVSFGATPLLAGIFYGLKPAVLAVIVHALVSLSRRSSGSPRSSVAIALLAFLAMMFLRAPFPLVVAAAGAAGFLLYRGNAAAGADSGEPSAARPRHGATLRTLAIWLAIWLVPVGLLVVLLGGEHVLARQAVFFSKVAVVTFGGAYAVLAYVAQQAVEVYQWITPAEMLDGLGLAESTPGPLIMVVQFVGFLGAHRFPGGLDPLVAGVLASVITTWVTFAPCFLFILVGAPYVEYLRGSRVPAAILSGIMAAVAGVILNLALWFGVHTLFGAVREARTGPLRFLVPDPASADLRAAALFAAALVLLLRRRLGLLPLFAGAAAVGVLVRLAAV